MKTKPTTKKHRVRRIADPAQIAAVISNGKYRDHLLHYERQADGSLLVEVKSA
jgi:hypothetical protein